MILLSEKDIALLDSILWTHGFCSGESIEIFRVFSEFLQEKENIEKKSESTPTINPIKDESLGVDYSIKADNGKYKPTLCHHSLIEAVSRVREYGGSIYGGTETWKHVEEQRYKDACYRHWLAYLENPDGVDEESGLPIIWHLACNVDFLVELYTERNKKKNNC